MLSGRADAADPPAQPVDQSLITIDGQPTDAAS